MRGLLKFGLPIAVATIVGLLAGIYVSRPSVNVTVGRTLASTHPSAAAPYWVGGPVNTPPGQVWEDIEAKDGRERWIRDRSGSAVEKLIYNDRGQLIERETHGWTEDGSGITTRYRYSQETITQKIETSSRPDSGTTTTTYDANGKPVATKYKPHGAAALL